MQYFSSEGAVQDNTGSSAHPGNLIPTWSSDDVTGERNEPVKPLQPLNKDQKPKDRDQVAGELQKKRTESTRFTATQLWICTFPVSTMMAGENRPNPVGKWDSSKRLLLYFCLLFPLLKTWMSQWAKRTLKPKAEWSLSLWAVGESVWCCHQQINHYQREEVTKAVTGRPSALKPFNEGSFSESSQVRGATKRPAHPCPMLNEALLGKECSHTVSLRRSDILQVQLKNQIGIPRKGKVIQMKWEAWYNWWLRP